MSRDLPPELSFDDVADVITLVREICDRWDDPQTWREHLLQGACTLLRGSVGLLVVDDAPKADWFGRPSVICVVGVPEPMRDLVQPAFAEFKERRFDEASQNLLPGITALHADLNRQGWVTAAGNQLADPDSYHASAHYQTFRKHIDSDDFVVSVRIVDVPRRPEAITIDRPHGAPPFGPREVALLKLLHDQIAPLIGVRLTTEEHLSRDGLSKRLRETLSLLLEGQSEKQIAHALGLAHGTLHQYVTMIYRHFQVQSRPELLAYFIRRTPLPRFKKVFDRP